MIRAHRTLWLSSALLIVVGFAVSALLWTRLPDPVPTHWNAAGQVNGWMPRFPGAVVAPLMMIGLLAVFAALPAISPRGFRMERFGAIYAWLVLGISALMLAIHVLALFAALGHDIAMQRGLPAILGLFFVLLGNWLPKIRRNLFVGIRTPWTIADEEVWVKTHRFGGKTMVVGGLATILAAVAGAPFWVPVALVLAASLVPAVYSYFVWRAMQPVR